MGVLAWALFLPMVWFLVHAAPVPSCSAPVVRSDCSWEGAQPVLAGDVGLLRDIGESKVITPPAVYNQAGATAATSATGIDVSNVVLVGFQLPDPSTAGPASIMRPIGMVGEGDGSGAASSSSTTVTLRDVRILVTPLTLQQHLDFFAPGPHNTTDVANATFVYTDRVSFLHVNSWFNGHATWLSVGLLVADSLEDALATSAVPPEGAKQVQEAARQLQRNYVLAADNGTIVPQLIGRCGVPTPVPLLVYLTANVTMSKPPVPQAGIDVTRPLVLAGLATAKTSVDWAMQVNQLIVAPKPQYRWGYVTMDSLVLENLGIGDSRSAEIAKPLGLTFTINLWFIYYDRTQLRLTVNNITAVTPHRTDLDYLLYWLTAYRSSSPMAQRQADSFLRDGMGVYVYQVKGALEPDTLHGVQIYTAGVHVDSCNYTTKPQVAPPLPLPPSDPLIGDMASMPLVVAISSAGGLRDALEDALPMSTNGLRDYIIMLRTSISLAPDAAKRWPPPGGQLVPYPVQLLGEGVQPTSNKTLVRLGFNFSQGVMAIPPGAKPGTLIIKRVRLTGLPQGPDAEQAARAVKDPLAAPQLWTLLLWSVASSVRGSIVLDHCEMVLPPREFEHLRARAAAAPSFEVKLRSPDDAPVGIQRGARRRGLLLSSEPAARAASMSFKGLRLDPSGGRFTVGTLEAGVLSATELTLMTDPLAAGAPRGHVWADGAGGVAVHGGGGGPLEPGRPAAGPTAWGTALGAAVGAAAAVGAGGALLLVARRQRRRRAAASAAEKLPVSGASGGPGEPSRSGSSSKSAERSGSEQQAQQQSFAKGDQVPLGLASACDLEHRMGGVQVATDRPLRLEPRCPEASQPPDGAAAAAAAGADRDSWHRVHAAISAMQQRILDRRLERPRRGNGVAERTPLAGMRAASPGAGAAAAGVAGGPDLRALEADGDADADAGPSALGLAALQQPPLEALGAGAEAGPSAAGLPLLHSLASTRGPGGMALQGAQPALSSTSALRLLEVVGRGTFATVFKAVWRGRFVAVKVLPLQPLRDSGGDARGRQSSSALCFERMAIMEAVVSSSLSHPNIVQVFHYCLTPLGGASGSTSPTPSPAARPPSQGAQETDAGPSGSNGRPDSLRPSGWELQLVMEYCEEGSLRSALDCQLLTDGLQEGDGGLTGLGYALSLAHDVAVAMLHLHSENMIHGDLKASNVLLARCSGAAAAAPVAVGSADDAAAVRHRFTAKVSDFGLSLHLGADMTHVSHIHAGTMTHMAPELLLDGRASKASDVYAYGILLWELLTGQHAFLGLPVPLLCIKVVKDQWRPDWPPGVSAPLRALAEACWSPSAAARPSFEEVVAYLEALMQQPSLLEQPGGCQEQGQATTAAPLGQEQGQATTAAPPGQEQG